MALNKRAISISNTVYFICRSNNIALWEQMVTVSTLLACSRKVILAGLFQFFLDRCKKRQATVQKITRLYDLLTRNHILFWLKDQSQYLLP